MVPLHIRRKVWQEYRPGQCDDKRPSQAWLDAAREAINHVAVQEDQLPLPDGAEVVKTIEAMIAKQKGS